MDGTIRHWNGEDFCARVLDLLNISEAHPTFRRFIDDFPVRTIRHDEGSSIVRHTFTGLGLSLYSSSRTGTTTVFAVHFYVVPQTFENGTVTEPYNGTLPFGVCVTDVRKEVHAKIGPPLDFVRLGESSQSESYRPEGSKLISVVFWYALPAETLAEVRVR